MPDADIDPPEPGGQADRLAIRLEGFEGPLDLLLDLARRQKVDLARISILALVEQFLAVIEGARRVRIELAADWLVMAAWLAWLKSRLLLPEADRPPEAEEAGDLLALRLQALDFIRAAAAALGQRNLLGHDVFARGAPENLTDIDRSRLKLETAALLSAYAAARRRAAARRGYTPRPVTVWTLQDALARFESLLGASPGWATLEHFLPKLADADPIATRAAYAATLLAGLEFARTGRAALRQAQSFGPIEIGPAS